VSFVVAPSESRGFTSDRSAFVTQNTAGFYSPATHVVQQGSATDVGGRTAAGVRLPAIGESVQRQVPEAEPEVEVPKNENYPVNPASGAVQYERSQSYGATQRAEAGARAHPRPSTARGGAAPDFITVGEAMQSQTPERTIQVHSYEFHVLDAIEYWTARGASDAAVLRSYMPDVIQALEAPHTDPSARLTVKPTQPALLPGWIDPDLIGFLKMIDPDAKERLAAWKRGHEKRRLRVLAEAEKFALKGQGRKPGPCKREPSAPKGGNPTHDEYARHVAMVKGYGPVGGELTWRTPEGVSYSFDTFNLRNETEVWEVKTRHEWASPLGMATAPFSLPNFGERIESIEEQRLRGLYVADRCGLRFKYAFDNCDAYLGFSQQWQGVPTLEYIPYPGESRVPCP
jgi:hypothetical protein